MIIRVLIIGTAITALAGCAERSSAIEPVSMGDAFSSVSCDRVVPMLNEERQRVAALSEQQNDAATGDALGVFLIAVPVSSLTGGDVSGDLAAAKGRSIALENRARTCGYSISYEKPQSSPAKAPSDDTKSCRYQRVFNNVRGIYEDKEICE